MGKFINHGLPILISRLIFVKTKKKTSCLYWVSLKYIQSRDIYSIMLKYEVIQSSIYDKISNAILNYFSGPTCDILFMQVFILIKRAFKCYVSHQW